MTTNDSTEGLTRKQLRELRAAQEAAGQGVTPAPEPGGAESAPRAELPDVVTAIPIVKPALTAPEPVAGTPVSGIVMHSAPIVRGPLTRSEFSLAGVAQHTQVAAEAAPQAATGANAGSDVQREAPALGRRALRQSRTEAVAEHEVPVVTPATQSTPEPVAPEPSHTHVFAEQAGAEPVAGVSPIVVQAPVAFSRRASRAANAANNSAANINAADTSPASTLGAIVVPRVEVPAQAEPFIHAASAAQPILAPRPQEQPAREASPTRPASAVTPSSAERAAQRAPLLHAEPPVVEGVATDAPVRADGLFASGDETDVEPLVSGVATSPVWNAPTTELRFDDIIATRPRGASASASPTTLIFNPGDMHAGLTGPIPSTGEMLVTASHPIAPGVASRGHVDGAVDDGTTDSILLDRELPVASSPTPIAAKSAISRSTAGPELVRPAEPEKTNKLTIALVVTGGLLLVAALATLVVGLMNGALS